MNLRALRHCGRSVPALLYLLACVAPAQESKPAATLSELRQRLSAQVSQSQFEAALWGIKIVSLDTGRTLFELTPDRLLSPASNSKLYTVALALERLGLDYRIRTSLYSTRRPSSRGTLKGDLIVYGRGDPAIAARLHGDDFERAIEPLVAALTNAGVRRINGDLIGDATFFHGPPYGSGWDWDDLQYYYGAELSALTVNDNALKVSIKPGDHVGAPCKVTLTPATSYLTLSNCTHTVGKGERRTVRIYRPLGGNLAYLSGEVPLDDSGFDENATVANPAGLFVALFQQSLARHGVKVRGKLRTTAWPNGVTNSTSTPCADWIELAAVESPPLSDISREILKPSQNLYTDLLLSHVGERLRKPDSGDVTSEQLGIRDLIHFLAEAGISQTSVAFEEGSGLSRNNLTCANATVTLLKFASQRPWGEAFRAALPVAGVDGTLRNRMKGTPAAGNVRAKTGTLRWADSLSGYVKTASGEQLAFSIMLNRYNRQQGARPSRAELDAIAVTLAEFTGSSKDSEH